MLEDVVGPEGTRRYAKRVIEGKLSIAEAVDKVKQQSEREAGRAEISVKGETDSPWLMSLRVGRRMAAGDLDGTKRMSEDEDFRLLIGQRLP